MKYKLFLIIIINLKLSYYIEAQIDSLFAVKQKYREMELASRTPNFVTSCCDTIAPLIKEGDIDMNHFDLSILVLAPLNVITEDSVSDQVMKNLNDQMQVLKKKQLTVKHVLDHDKSLTRLEKMQLSAKNQQLLDLNERTEIALLTKDLLSERIYKPTNKIITTRNKKKELSIKDYMRLSKEHNTQFIVDLINLEFISSEGTLYAQIFVRLFDREQNEIVLSNLYKGEGHYSIYSNVINFNRGSIRHCIIQAIDNLAKGLSEEIGKRVPNENEGAYLRRLRFSLLERDLYSQPPNQEILDIITTYIPDIPVEHYNRGIMNKAKNRFIAQLSIYDQDEYDFRMKKNLPYISRDREIEPLTDKDYLPYFVIGAKYGNRWYLNEEVSHKLTRNYSGEFNSDNPEKAHFVGYLLGMDIFRYNTTEYSASFWDHSFYFKRKKIMELNFYDRFTSSLNNNLITNVNYIGVPAPVVNVAQKAFDEYQRTYAKGVVNNVFVPLYEDLKTDTTNSFVDYYYAKEEGNIFREYHLFYSRDMACYIHPVSVTDKNGKTNIRMFVNIEGKENMYEWITKNIKIGSYLSYSEAVRAKFKNNEEFSFSKLMIRNNNFWNNDILRKENGEYTNLKVINK